MLPYPTSSRLLRHARYGFTLTAGQKRQQLLMEKKSDPAVLVDIPKTPGAEELEKGASMRNKDSYWSTMHLGKVTSSYGN